MVRSNLETMRAADANIASLRAALATEKERAEKLAEALASERIISVAISAFGIVASLPAPARHSDVLHKLWGFNQTLVPGERQGFLTNSGRFVNRRDAAVLALAAGQVDKLISAPDLYSEDLW